MTQVSDLNNFFSKATLIDMIQNDGNDYYNKIIQKYTSKANNTSNLSTIKEMYNILDQRYRNEYFYKNTLFNNNFNDSNFFLNEQRISKSIADVIILNDNPEVFEIKTELDSVTRLRNQIENYYKAFPKITVLTFEENIKKVNKTLKDYQSYVGISVINKQNEIIKIKHSSNHFNELDKEVIFKILRKKEYENIIYKIYGETPKVSDFKYYKTCKEIFERESLEKTYPLFLEQLKSRKRNQGLENYPTELRYLLYFTDLKENEKEKLLDFLNQ